MSEAIFTPPTANNLQFTPDRETRFTGYVAKYEQTRSALLPALYLAQDQWGVLTDEVLIYVAGRLDMHPREVIEAASFYTLFRRKDRGRYCFQVCNNITCSMMGSETLLKELGALGVKHDEVAPDGMMSLVHVQCLGSCDTAPVVQINDDYFENMTPQKARRAVEALRSGVVLEELQKELS